VNILVLHALGDANKAPRLLKENVFFLRTQFPQHSYIYHDAALPPPAYLQQAQFDAIFLDVTFLGYRWLDPVLFHRFLKQYSFVAESDAVKIAFPQDEYDCHEVLDDWMCAWRVDTVFSVISSGWDILYPRYSRLGDIRLGYTGYVDEELLNWKPKPFGKRRIDIGYRARMLPPNFGRLGQTKCSIGRDVAALSMKFDLAVDIVLGESSMLMGDAWLHFLDDSKFTLGANSGSSLLDPVGTLRANVRTYLANNPNASFQEVEAACFPGLDGLHCFTAISPRVLEAALLGSAQILVDGSYSDIIQADEHFIAIRPDASNFDEVVERMSDVSCVEVMISRCREAILSVPALRYGNRAVMLLGLVEEIQARKHSRATNVDLGPIIARYSHEMPSRYRAHWRRKAVRTRILTALRGYPKFYEFLRATRSHLPF